MTAASPGTGPRGRSQLTSFSKSLVTFAPSRATSPQMPRTARSWEPDAILHAGPAPMTGTAPSSCELEPIEVHDFAPRRHEVAHERPARSSIDVTPDGCVDHREGVADDETHATFT